MFRILALGLILPCLGFSRINDQLQLFLDIHDEDSVLSITRTGPEKISVLVVDGATHRQRTLEGTVPLRIIDRLKSNAEAESIPWNVADFQPAPALQPEPVPGPGKQAGDGPAGAADGVGKPGETMVSQVDLRKNKLRYVSYQTLFSTYTYGIALPIALEAYDKALAMGLLALPISFGAHYYVAREKEYHDSHLIGTGYFASSSLLLSYTLPFLVLGPDANAFRVGNFAVLAAYPLGLHYGYKHGTRFQDEPGRVSLQSSFAFAMGSMGYIGILLWADLIRSGEVGVRLAVAQALGAAVGGHYLSYKYRTHEKVPGGIGPGIFAFSLLGGMAAGSSLASIQPDSPEAVGVILLSGVGGGFLGGLKYFHDKYDTFERAGYNSLGMLAGAVTPLGLMLLLEAAPDDPEVYLWAQTAGAAAGYFLTRAITGSLVEKPRSLASEKGFVKNFAFNPIPIPMPETRNGKHSIKWAAQFLSASF